MITSTIHFQLYHSSLDLKLKFEIDVKMLLPQSQISTQIDNHNFP